MIYMLKDSREKMATITNIGNFCTEIKTIKNVKMMEIKKKNYHWQTIPSFSVGIPSSSIRLTEDWKLRISELKCTSIKIIQNETKRKRVKIKYESIQGSWYTITPLKSNMHKSDTQKEKYFSCSVVSNSLWPNGL